MSNKESSTLEHLNAADPALAVTEEELARSREKSLAIMLTDVDHLAIGGFIEDFNQQPVRRRFRLMAGAGLVAAAAAVIVGVVVTGQLGQPAVPAATQPVIAPETGSSEIPPRPEITGRMPTFDNHIVTGGNGNKAAVSNDPQADFHMDAGNGGKLGLNSAGCFVSAGTDGNGSGLIFPSGTQVTETGVVLPDGKTFTIGDEFLFGGGIGPVDPGECSPSGSAFLVQSWGPIR